MIRSTARSLFTVLALSTLAALSTACAADGPDPDVDAKVGAENEASPAQLAGRYRFVFEAARKEAIREQLSKKVSGPELEQAMKEAQEEADASVLEFGKGGHFVSWIGDKAILEGDYVAVPAGASGYDVTISGKTVHVAMPDEDTIIVSDPDKGPLKFERE
jgi:hypothetical protein